MSRLICIPARAGAVSLGIRDQLPGGEVLAFARDEAGREIRRVGSRGFAQEQEWDEAGQLLSQRAGHYPEGGTSLYASLSRGYEYDNAGNLSALSECGETGSETRRMYRTDRNGQVTEVKVTGGGRYAGAHDEVYRYDSCGYQGDVQYQKGHRLSRAGNRTYEYDAAGRMVSRTIHRDGYRPEQEQFRWDSRDQLTGYRSATGEQWCYCYDGSGRRIEKRCDAKRLRTTYLWDGDSIAEIREYRDDTLYSVRHLVFSGFELLSQQYSRSRQAHPSEPVRWVTRTSHAVSELTGRPLMFFNSTGDVVRRPAETTLWGRLIAAVRDDGTPRRPEDEEADPGMLYAGQWRDVESGLCYNRFRYYEPESGMYLVSDPLGLGGGEQTYRDVGNPLLWSDPLGLTPLSLPVPISLDPWGEGAVLRSIPVPKDGMIVEMAMSPGQTKPGGWATMDHIPDVDYVRNKLAVIPDFKPEISHVQRFYIPEGVQIQVGPVGPQVSGGKIYKGGGSQIQILNYSDRAKLIPIGKPRKLPAKIC